MSEHVIEVKDIGKQYRLGKVGSATIAEDLKRWWARMRGMPDPTLLRGDVNDREASGGDDYIWALKDIGFSVNKGDVLGVIGKNGAGKSTLLKILSQVTEPTIGSVRIKGRVASLLEVGTGFHPDLSGRENVFLNGAILGMTKAEIRSRFDEIVSFSGVERYIDTPVKRYSSGMKVRLGFAVAAHLNPEILIVDVVLAVGDFEFQRKCMGKMKEVSTEFGRTILFVSHNMKAIQTLCNRAILLENGRLIKDGPTKEVANDYLNKNALDKRTEYKWEEDEGPGNDKVRFLFLALCNRTRPGDSLFHLTDELELVVRVINIGMVSAFNLSIHLFTIDDVHILNVASPLVEAARGKYEFRCRVPANLLNDIGYSIRVMVVENGKGVLTVENAITFEMNEEKRDTLWFGQWKGVIRPRFEWEVKALQKQTS